MSANPIPANYYIDPDEFEAALREFSETRSNELLNLISERFFLPLARGFVAGFVYGETVCRDSLAAVGAAKCWLKIHAYNPGTGRAFAFFTKVVKYAVLDELRRLKKVAIKDGRIEQVERERLVA